MPEKWLARHAVPKNRLILSQVPETRRSPGRRKRTIPVKKTLVPNAGRLRNRTSGVDLPPAEDVMTRRDDSMLSPIADGIWEHDHPFRLATVFELGHRMTAVRLSSGDVVVHSPTPWTPELGAELDRLGPVRFVLAPNTMHNLFLRPWGERYPGARFLAVPGFAKRYPDLRCDGLLVTGCEELPEAELRVRTLDGMPGIHETAVLHVPSRSLIVADLVFNIGRDVSFLTSLLLRATATYGGVGVSRLFRYVIKDRAAFRESLEEILSWDFERVVVGHGRIIDSDARRHLREAYAWLE